jgi:lipopolysaccharide export system permease protein
VRTIERAFLREASQTSLAMLLIFILLFVAVTLVKILSRAVAGDVPAGLVMSLLGFQTVDVLALILPLAFFVGMLFALSRWYRDNELTVLAACGVGLFRFVAPAMMLAGAFAAASALFALYLAPLAERTADLRKHALGAQFEPAGIEPGVFNELRKGEGFFYAEGIDRKSGELTGVFVNTIEAGKEGVLVADRGTHFTDVRTGDQFLVLFAGTHYEGRPGRGDFRILEFERYQLRIEPRAIAPGVERPGARSTADLLASEEPRARAELHKRLSKPLSIFVLALIALVFGYVRPRGGRYLGLFIAVLIYFVYSNLLGVGETLIKSARVPAVLGLWWVHIIFLLFALTLLWRRAGNLPLIPVFSLQRT